MRLADFILANKEQILEEWETFARTTAPGGGMDVEALRDHAAKMLVVIATDLKTPQDEHEKEAKSKGEESSGGSKTAAESHGSDRADSGFTVEEMVSEFRALRASVIRLWTESLGELRTAEIEDLTRFNEAVDQSLAESVARFSDVLEQSKEMFIAMLGHDLRTPIGAIKTSAQFLLDANVLQEPYRNLVERMEGSAERTTTMVGELLDFTRSRLGSGIPVVKTEVDLGEIVAEVCEEIMAARPGSDVKVTTDGDLTGCWDPQRIAQALGNVIVNAVQHGKPDAPVTVHVSGHANQVTIETVNKGTPIPQDQLIGIFNPMKSRDEPRPASTRGPTDSLGLGLYIAERIVSSHQGSIDVTSSQGEGTSFTICLPRR